MTGSSPAGNTTSTQVTTPWTAQQPYLTQAMGTAENLLTNYTPTYYPGQTVAPLNQTQQTALTGTAMQAANGEPITGAASNLATNVAAGSPVENPGSALQLGTAMGSQLPDPNNAYFQNLLSSIRTQVDPAVQATFTSGNSMNNPAAAFATSEGETAALAQPEFQAYEQGLTQQQQAAQNIGTNYTAGTGQQVQSLFAAPSIQQMPYTDLSNMFSAGTDAQTQAQADINANIAQYNYGETLPYQQLATFENEMGGTGSGSTTTGTTPYFQNTFANALSSAGGAASLLFGPSSVSGASSSGLVGLLSSLLA